MRYLLITLLFIGCNTTGTEPEIKAPEVGDRYGGGIVFIVTNTVAYVVAEEDMTDSLSLGCRDQDNGISSSRTVGDGMKNTIALDRVCGLTNIAPHIALNSEYNGYDDWFIPAIQSSEYIYSRLHKNNLGNFEDAEYWTSSAYNLTNFKFHTFNYTDSTTNYKHAGEELRVRLVRADTLTN